MDNAITWEQLIWAIVLFFVALWFLGVVIRSIAAFFLYRQETKSEDHGPTSEPYAGKTLGL